jgi:replication fork clamp-binding protein CrfC
MEMDDLIKTVNKLQDAFTTVGLSNPVDLPQIVVIGSQSSGKSSVLENIVKRDFLPRGSGIVTRRPLILQLINNRKSGKPLEEEKDEEKTKADNSPSSSEPEPEEWGEFLHKPNEKFYDFEKIRQEIVQDTDAKTGGTKGISPMPINLRIYSPHVLTLTLVDLPGLTKVPVGDQPKDIEKQIREMIMKFIIKPNAIILAVTSANTDLANSDGLKLAREVDPDGTRTIGVLTKIDLMDAGTDVVDILAGRIIPLRHGYIPVVNRGQRDIDTRKSIQRALDDERRYFETHPTYSSKAQFCGTPFLARKLNSILLAHIKHCLPEIKAKISSCLASQQAELHQLGDCDVSGQNTILSIITEFCNDYKDILDGNSPELSSNELSGGARISFVFHEIIYNAITCMDSFDQLRDNDIRTLLYNTSGSSPALFVPSSAFKILSKQQIKRLEEPSIKCVNMIHEELVRMLSEVLRKPVFKRFPVLRERFHAVVTAFFSRRVEATSRMVSSIVAAECAYINVCHPDFISGHKAYAVVQEKLYGPKSAQSPISTNGINALDKSGKPIEKTSSATLYESTTTPTATNGLFSSFFDSKKNAASASSSGKKSAIAGQLDSMPNVLKASGQVSERELFDIEVIKLFLHSYFSIVKRTICDMVPKSVVLNMVNYTKEELQATLLAELYKPNLVDELLKESEFVTERRKECRKMIQALSKADEIVANL